MNTPGEFDIIRNYFHRHATAIDLVAGIGDDGAVLRPRAGFDQVVVTDTIIEGRHFPKDLPADDIGWRALAVNISDIAAMGAVPRFAFLNLAVEHSSGAWLQAFSNGFFELAEMTNTVLAGGDTTQGPLSITVTVIGEVPNGKAIMRSGARIGDSICISGTPGEAAAGLERLQRGDAEDALVKRFRRPMPRLALARTLQGVAHAAIDISDGLVADLGHILESSGVGANIRFDALPVSDALRDAVNAPEDYVLAGGDDYELCFCLPKNAVERVQSAAECDITVIGEITAQTGLSIVDHTGAACTPKRQGWEHFRGEGSR